jgi:hypothetical protein
MPETDVVTGAARLFGLSLAAVCSVACHRATTSADAGGADGEESGPETSSPPQTSLDGGAFADATLPDASAANASDTGPPDREPPGYPPPGRQRLQGFVVFGNELHGFQPCNEAVLIWVDLQGGEPGWDKVAGVVDPVCEVREAGPPVCSVKFAYVELDATVSGPCRCGHLGKYGRSLRVHEVIAASRTAPAACGHVEPIYP